MWSLNWFTHTHNTSTRTQTSNIYEWNIPKIDGNDLRMLKMFLSFLMTSSVWIQTRHIHKHTIEPIGLPSTFFFLFFRRFACNSTKNRRYPFSLFSFCLEKYRRWNRRRKKKWLYIMVCSCEVARCFMVVDDAKWKRKSCQHASKMLDLWLISFGFRVLLGLFIFHAFCSLLRLVQCFFIRLFLDTFDTAQINIRLKLTIKPEIEELRRKLCSFYTENWFAWVFFLYGKLISH